MFEVICIVAIICSAYFVQSAFAFGGPLLAVPLLGVFIGVRDAVVITTVFSIISSILLLKLWKHIDWTETRWLSPGLILGLAAGLSLFSIFGEHILAGLLIMYIIACVAADFSKSRIPVRSRVPVQARPFFSGFGGGLIQGATGIGGGPPVAAYLKSKMKSIDGYRATYSFTWLLGNIFRLSFMGFADFVHQDVVKIILIATPFFIVTTYAGYYWPRKLNIDTFNILLDVLLLISAGVLAIKQFV